MSNRSVINIDGDFSLRPPDVALGTLVHSLPYKRSIVGSLFLGGFLAAFISPFFFVGSIMGGPDGGLFALVTVMFSVFWMLGWSVAVSLIALLFLGSMFGRECLFITPGQLVIRMELFGAGFARTFRGDEIKDLQRIEPEKNAPLSWRGPYMTFDHEGEAINFGCTIDRLTADLLTADIVETAISKSAPEWTDVEDSGTAVREQYADSPFQQKSDTTSVQPPLSMTSPSTMALFAANLIPVAGVLMFGWSVGEVMLLFWAESAVIGFYNLCKMWVIGRWATLFMGPFFLGHYGGFMVGHLLFIYGFMIKGPDHGGVIPMTEVFSDFVSLSPALLALFISHGVSFSRNFLKRKEFEPMALKQLMVEPYRRIVVMHITIIFGGFLVMMLDNALPALVLMICLKVGADLKAHFRAHK